MHFAITTVNACDLLPLPVDKNLMHKRVVDNAASVHFFDNTLNHTNGFGLQPP